MGKKKRIFFADGTEYRKKKDGILIDIQQNYIHLIDLVEGNEQIIPLYRVFRIIFLKDRRMGDGN
ncbi:MAG TPA: hypothetical protein ENI36_01380 [Thermoplasmatales archaeon]|nr:hypothetical protein [Thermoplasmatales archaeon]